MRKSPAGYTWHDAAVSVPVGSRDIRKRFQEVSNRGITDNPDIGWFRDPKRRLNARTQPSLGRFHFWAAAPARSNSWLSG